MNTEINLLPGRKKHATVLLKKRKTLEIIAVSILFMVSFLSVTLFMFIALSPLPSLRQREKDEIKKMGYFNEMIVKVIYTKNRLTNITQILQKRASIADSVTVVKDMLPENAEIDEIHLDAKKVSITIISTTLSTFDQFLGDFVRMNNETKRFKKVSVMSVMQDFEKGHYALTIDLNQL
jgi:hypothetical protein